jgi:Ras-related protein Rab-7A
VEGAFQDIAKAAASQEKDEEMYIPICIDSFFPTTVTLTKQDTKKKDSKNDCPC